MAMKWNAGDRVELKKNHPCGGNTFEIMRVGMDLRIRCETCNTQIRLERSTLEKRLKRILSRKEENV